MRAILSEMMWRASTTAHALGIGGVWRCQDYDYYEGMTKQELVILMDP